MKEVLFAAVEAQENDLCELADSIFDHPDRGHCEHFAQQRVATYLEKNGFKVEKGVGGVETALRAEYQSMEGGPTIGFCGEYDALPIGHACGHHLQTAFACGAIVAMKNVLGGTRPFKVVMYATPDEEGNVASGKKEMIDGGCFSELDVALIAHGGAETTLDETSMAFTKLDFTFTGISSHPGAHPEVGRPAWDAFQIAVHGMNFLRAHLPLGTQLHWAITGGQTPEGGDFNAVSKGTVSLCARDVSQLEKVAERVVAVLKGAAIMTETQVSYSSKDGTILPKLRVAALSESFYENAKEAGCERIEPPLNKPIVTDTGNLSRVVPTLGGRIAFAPKGTGAHSKEWLAAGKSEGAHRAVVAGAKTLAGIAYDFLTNDELRRCVRDQWEEARKHAQ